MSTEKNSEFEEKVLFVNRCTKVTKGGRKFSFSALIAVGNHNGKVGYGFAKANELTDAIQKGGELARKNMIEVKMEGMTIPHEVFIKMDGVSILLKPAPAGKGLIAGSKIRSVLELAGIKDVTAKIVRGTNPLNQVYALFKAFSSFQRRKEYEEQRKTLPA